VSALGVTGDPAGWQHASDTIAAAVRQLTDELDAADAHGGSSLRGAWYGPVADAHQELWSKRHSRYGDLLHQAGRAAGALGDFAGRLWNFQVQAANLESQWLGLGLHLTSDGLSFTLPLGWENLEHEIQNLLHARVTEAVREVEAMWDDIRGAVSDLATIAGSVIDAAEDFDAIELSVIGGAIAWEARAVLADYRDWKEIPSHLNDFATLIDKPLARAADRAEQYARLLKSDVNLAPAADQSALEDAADRAAGQASLLRGGARIDAQGDGGGIGLIAVNAATVGITAYQIGHDGFYGAMVKDKDAGLVAGTIADDATEGALEYFAPEIANTPIGLAISGVVGAGVGAGVQDGVDFLASHPKVVEAGVQSVKDVGQGIENVAGWEAKHLTSLL
jgi:hypothetical protein